MKKLLSLSLFCLFFAVSCKKNDPNEVKTAATTLEKNKKKAPYIYKQSLAQWSLNKPFKNGTLDPMDFPKIAKELGFSGVEYVTQLYPELAAATNKPEFKNVVTAWANNMAKRSKEAQIENVIVMVDHSGELADPDPKKLAQAISNHKIWMDAAAILGAHSVRANLFGELDPAKWHTLSVAALKELGAYGEKIGVNIIIENHGGWSSDAAKLVAVMKEVNMPTVGVLPDFGNFCVKRRDGDRWGSPCVEEYDVYKGTQELMQYAVGASAKSYNFDANGNETKLDYQRLIEIVNTYKTKRFKGYIGTEYEGDLPDPKDGVLLTKKLVEKSIQNLK